MTDHLPQSITDPPDVLAYMHEQLDRRLAICARLMAGGVVVRDPATAYIEGSVRIGARTVIEPNTTITGETVIGADCRIGPNAIVERSRIGDRCAVFASVVRDSTMEAGSDLGPFAHLRGESQVGEGVHLGHSVEVNRSRIGRGTKAAHFCYLGDAEIGEGVNIGAGTVTCNYDGESKHRTIIEDGVFIGSDSMLVAPLRIGRGAATGAGSVVTRDVEPGERVAGAPAKPLRREAGE